MEQNNFYGIGIGASAGGQQAICDFFDHLPSNTGAAYFVTTHLLKDYNSKLNEIIQLHTKMPIVRVEEEMVVHPDTVYLLIENTFMYFENGCLLIRPRKESERINRAINIFFTSLASEFKSKAIGIVLSGTGNDGTEGIQSIKANGGVAFVQSPISSAFDGMPVAAIKGDHPFAIENPARLAETLVHLLQHNKLIATANEYKNTAAPNH